MEIWSVTFQSSVIGAQSPLPYLLAKGNSQDCRLLFERLASVQQIACSRMNDFGVFRVYIKFDFPPEPSVARKVLSKICVENNAVHYTISDPLNYQEPVLMPYQQSQSGLDVALDRIKQNQAKIISDVATGQDLWVETL